MTALSGRPSQSNDSCDEGSSRMKRLPGCSSDSTLDHTSFIGSGDTGLLVDPSLKAVDQPVEATDPTHIISSHDEVKKTHRLIAHLTQITPLDAQALSDRA